MLSRIFTKLIFALDIIRYSKDANSLRYKMMKNNSKLKKPQEITYDKLENIYIGKNVLIHPNCILRILNGCHLYIGDDTQIGYYSHIAGKNNNIIIKKNVLIADRVFISTENYHYENINKPIKNQGFTSKGDIVIDDDCWIGIGSSILSGVRIGKHSIIGANSVVTNDVTPYSIAVGNPARIIKKYDFKEKKWLRIKE